MGSSYMAGTPRTPRDIHGSNSSSRRLPDERQTRATVCGKGNLHCRLAVLSCPVTARRQSINVNGDWQDLHAQFDLHARVGEKSDVSGWFVVKAWTRGHVPSSPTIICSVLVSTSTPSQSSKLHVTTLGHHRPLLLLRDQFHFPPMR